MDMDAWYIIGLAALALISFLLEQMRSESRSLVAKKTHPTF